MYRLRELSDGSCDTVLSRIAVRVWYNVHRVMHDHLSPLLILLLIILGATNINMVAYISVATYFVFVHSLSSTAVRFVPLNKDQHPWWGHIKPVVVRAIEVSHTACKDEFRRNPRSQTDDNRNAMFQSFLSKLFKNETGWRYCRTAAMGKTGKKCLFF